MDLSAEVRALGAGMGPMMGGSYGVYARNAKSTKPRWHGRTNEPRNDDARPYDDGSWKATGYATILSRFHASIQHAKPDVPTNAR